jgi:hypothetical protein
MEQKQTGINPATRRTNLVNLAVMLAAIVAALLIYKWRKGQEAQPFPVKVKSSGNKTK